MPVLAPTLAPVPTLPPTQRAPVDLPTVPPTGPVPSSPTPAPSRAPSAEPSPLATLKPTDAPLAEPTRGPTAAPTNAAFVAAVSLTLDGITPEASAATRLALRQAVQLTLKLPDVALVGEPVITAAPEPLAAARRGLGAAGAGAAAAATRSVVSMQVTLPPASQFNPGNVSASSESSRVAQALSAPAAQGPSELIANFAAAYAAAAAAPSTATSQPAPVLAIVSVAATVAPALPPSPPSAKPSEAARSESAGSAAGDGASSLGVSVGASLFAAAAVLAGAYWWCGRRKAAALAATDESRQSRGQSSNGKISFGATSGSSFRTSNRQLQPPALPPPRAGANHAKQSVYVGYGDAYGASSSYVGGGMGQDNDDIFDEVPAPSLRNSANRPQRSPYLSDEQQNRL